MSLLRLCHLYLLGPCIGTTHTNAQRSGNYLFLFPGEVTLISEEILVKVQDSFHQQMHSFIKHIKC